MAESHPLHDLLPQFLSWLEHAPASDPIKKRVFALAQTCAALTQEEEEAPPARRDDDAPPVARCEDEESGFASPMTVVGVQGYAGHCRACGLPAVVVIAPASWGEGPLILDARGGPHLCCCGGKRRV